MEPIDPNTYSPIENNDPQSASSFLTQQEAIAGLDLLVQRGLTLPYGLQPGMYPGGWQSGVITSRSRWEQYNTATLWNPPGFLKHLDDYTDADTNAGTAPTWDELRAAAVEATTINTAVAFAASKADKLIELKDKTRMRIANAYGETTFYEEVELRLRDGQTEEQDTERERIRTKYREIKARIEGATRQTELDDIDIMDDSLWSS